MNPLTHGISFLSLVSIIMEGKRFKNSYGGGGQAQLNLHMPPHAAHSRPVPPARQHSACGQGTKAPGEVTFSRSHVVCERAGTGSETSDSKSLLYPEQSRHSSKSMAILELLSQPGTSGLMTQRAGAVHAMCTQSISSSK